MGYRELFLVLASVVLLTLLMTQINSHTVEGREALQQLELEHTATAIAQQFVEEAKSKKFDGFVSLVPITSSSSFTPIGSFGAISGQVYPQFDDVDDYHNFSQTVYINGESFEPDSTNGIPFNVSIQVQYVSEANPDSAVAEKTYFKRMTVTVTGAYIPSSITAKHVFSYFGVNM